MQIPLFCHYHQLLITGSKLQSGSLQFSKLFLAKVGSSYTRCWGKCAILLAKFDDACFSCVPFPPSYSRVNIKKCIVKLASFSILLTLHPISYLRHTSLIRKSKTRAANKLNAVITFFKDVFLLFPAPKLYYVSWVVQLFAKKAMLPKKLFFDEALPALKMLATGKRSVFSPRLKPRLGHIFRNEDGQSEASMRRPLIFTLAN